MRYFIIIFSIVFILVNLSFAGNDTRTSYVGVGELLYSPSAQSSGMGETGVSHVHEKSLYYNPGSLGIFALENKVVLSGLLIDAEHVTNFLFDSKSFAIPLLKNHKGGSKFQIAIGGYYSISKLGPYEETTFEYPDGTGRYFALTLKNYNATISSAYNGKIQLGFGLTVKKYKEDIFEYKVDGFAFDLGIIVRKPFIPEIIDRTTKTYFLPTFGLSIQNLGDDLDYSSFNPVINNPRPTRPSDDITRLPRVKNIGISCEFGLMNKQNAESPIKILSILPSYEMSKLYEYDWESKYGLEVGLFETFYYRIGKNNFASNYQNSTDGLSFNTQGFFNLVVNSDGSNANFSENKGLFTDIISIEYSYANSVYIKSYHEIVVTYQL